MVKRSKISKQKISDYLAYSCYLIFCLSLVACNYDTNTSDEIKQLKQKIEFLEKKSTQHSKRIHELETNVIENTENNNTVKENTNKTKVDSSISSSESEPSKSSNVIKDITFNIDDNTKDDPYFGSKDPNILIIAYSDLLCENCRDFLSKIPDFKSQIEKNIKTKDIQVQFRLKDFPLNKTPLSTTASIYANCAGEKGLYWEYMEEVSKLTTLSDGKLKSIFNKDPFLSKDIKKNLDTCSKSKKYSVEVLKDKQQGEAIGISGVPSFFIGSKVSENSFFGVILKGNQEVESLIQATEILKQNIK